MKNQLLCLIAIYLCLPNLANANSDLFKPHTGVYYPTAELIENDRGLLCVGYTDKECAEGEFKAIAGGGSTDGSFFYDIEYSLRNFTCRASIGKYHYAGEGWITLDLKSGKNCISRTIK